MASKTNYPLPANLEEGTQYYWCHCGHSQGMPLCDGSHERHEGMKPVAFTATETRTLYLCACASTNNPPFCDGSHCKVK